MHFNGDISLGTLVELAAFGFTLGVGLMRMGRLEAKMNIMFDWFQTTVILHGGPVHDVKRFHGDDE